MRFEEELTTLIKARYPLIYILTSEEERVKEIIYEIALSFKTPKVCVEWSITTGLRSDREEFGFGTANPVEALNKINDLTSSKTTDYLFILNDFHPYLENPTVRRRLKEVTVKLKNQTKSSMIIISAVQIIPPELDEEITLIDCPLPDEVVLFNELNTILDEISKSQVASEMYWNKITDKIKRVVVKTALGLTVKEFNDAVRKSLVRHRCLDVFTIASEKEQIVKKTGVLEFYSELADLTEIGGLNRLKEWIQKRKLAFSDEFKEFVRDEKIFPRGVFLCGPPGTGKSLTAKVIAKWFEFPLLRFDVARIFSAYVGESERNISLALKIAETAAPCVLWIDEVEKALAGVRISHQLDSGVTARVVGQLLTWLQERKSPVFVVCTSNNPNIIPPEFIRSGRFDAVFHVGLPNENERKEIFEIHLRKRGRNPVEFSVNELSEKTEGFSGAEIEQIIIDSLYDAFFDGKELDNDYILQQIEQTIPVSKKRVEEIRLLEEWCKKYAISASSYEEKKDEPAIEL